MNIKIYRANVKNIKYCSPIIYFEKYKDIFGSCLFTGDGINDISEYTFIGIFPHTIISYDGDKLIFQNEQGVKKEKGFWENLSKVLTQTNFDEFNYPASLCGGMGYLSYEILQNIENLTKTTVDSYELIPFNWIFFNVYYVFDHLNKKAYQIDIEYESKSKIIKKTNIYNGYNVKNIQSECTREEYMEKVEKIRDYIFRGYVYEVNLTQQINGSFFGDAYSLFKKLFSINNAPFSAYINLEDTKIISNSPELFLRCKGKEVETRPIKGTIKRGRTEEIDKENIELLINSKKDQAELYMIIDLMRNDLGKVSEIGSVKVINPKRLETYKNVHHLVGIVIGKLKESCDYFDLLKAAFPGGSITGCPKVIAMEIIDEMEKYTRNLYTGSIFMMNKEFFISNIVIRSAIIKNNKIFVNSGGAITIDSIPEEEYNESIIKIKNIINSMKQE